MKMQLKLMLLLLGVLLILLPGCDKKKAHDTTITAINLVNLNPKGNPIFTGTFTATGGLNTSGTQLMFVVPETADPTLIDCNLTLTAAEGTIDIVMHCSVVTNTGKWHISSGTGLYKFTSGSGSLKMYFPPSPSVPPGAIAVETMTGKILMDGI
jgi:hypothetical protein